MHKKNIIIQDNTGGKAARTLVMVHGRGANAADILSFAANLNVDDYILLAPEATNNTWYPYSFLAPVKDNEPWLTSALEILSGIVEDLEQNGIPAHNIFFLGFSQGACLTLEFVSRKARRYGGVIAFTGGLIGDQIDPGKYKGDFEQTPVFIGSSDPDPHVPVQRVHASAALLQQMGAAVTEKLYPSMGHTINADEIAAANAILAIH